MGRKGASLETLKGDGYFKEGIKLGDTVDRGPTTPRVSLASKKEATVSRTGQGAAAEGVQIQANRSSRSGTSR